MKFQSSKLIRLASSGVAGMALAQSLQAATTLSGTGLADNDTVPADHGSNAAGTPDVTLAWSPVGAFGWQAYNGWPTGGQVYQLDGPVGGYTGAITYSIAFTPSSPTVAVALASVDLNDWIGPATPGQESTTLDWIVSGSTSGTLGSATGLLVPDGTVVPLNFGIQGLGGETLTLSFTPTGGAGSYFAIDNLSFDQIAVPEPSGAVLALVGLGATALRRRRK